MHVPPRDPPPPAATPAADGGALHRVVYVSKAVPGAGPETLADIFRVSRRRNRADDVTGLLTFFDGRFLQYLEGPGRAVHATLARIEADARHVEVEVLLDEPALAPEPASTAGDPRLFGYWAMGRLEVGSGAWRRLVRADWPRLAPADPAAESGLSVLQALARSAAADLDRIHVLGDGGAGGGNGRGRRDTDIVVEDPPPELRAARLNFAAAMLIAIALAVTLLYQWLR